MATSYVLLLEQVALGICVAAMDTSWLPWIPTMVTSTALSSSYVLLLEQVALGIRVAAMDTSWLPWIPTMVTSTALSSRCPSLTSLGTAS